MIDMWVVPCNTKKFDVISHLKEESTVVWKNAFTIQTGDIVYLYLSAPYSEIKYKFVVESVNISEEQLQEHSYAIVKEPSHNFFSRKTKYMSMKLEKEFPEQYLPLSVLKCHGLNQVQIQARDDRTLKKFLLSKEDELLKGGEE